MFKKVSRAKGEKLSFIYKLFSWGRAIVLSKVDRKEKKLRSIAQRAKPLSTNFHLKVDGNWITFKCADETGKLYAYDISASMLLKMIQFYGSQDFVGTSLNSAHNSKT